MKAKSFVILFVLLALLVTSCAPAATPTPAPKPTDAPKPTVAPTQPAAQSVTLRMAWYNDGNEGEVMRALLDRYEKENPGIKVVMDTVAYADLDKTLQPQAEAGTPPDLARITDLPRYRAFLLDLRPYLKDAAAWEKNWSPQFLQALRPGTDTQGLYGYPTQFTVSGPFINRTLFAQAGVPVPSDTKEKVTWDEWIAAATKVAQATKTDYAVAIDRSGHRFWGPTLSMCASYVDSMTDKSFTIDSPGFRKAAQMLVDWSKNKLMPPEVWGGSGGQYTAANTYFLNGKLVFYFSGSWQVQQFTSGIGNKFEWDAVPNPYGDCGSTGMPGGAALIAFKATKNPKEVGKLVDWLTSEPVLEEFTAKTLFLPGHLGLAKKGITYPTSSKVLNVFLKEIPKLSPEAYNLQFQVLTGTFNPEMRDRLSQVINGELTLDEAIKKMQTKMDEAAAALK
jgi:alpha-1,4-digalacturonate transport system substrate-binding protein